MPRNLYREQVSFLKTIDANLPRSLDIHLVVENYAAHKKPSVKRLLATRESYES
jgi:hypothetical protein